MWLVNEAYVHYPIYTTYSGKKYNVTYVNWDFAYIIIVNTNMCAFITMTYNCDTYSESVPCTLNFSFIKYQGRPFSGLLHDNREDRKKR